MASPVRVVQVAFSGSTPNPNGDVFSLSLATPGLPELTIALNETNTVLTWPTSAPGFTLQSTPDVGAAGSWNTNTSTPAIVNGYYTVTNSSAGQKLFYRLIQ